MFGIFQGKGRSAPKMSENRRWQKGNKNPFSLAVAFPILQNRKFSSIEKLLLSVLVKQARVIAGIQHSPHKSRAIPNVSMPPAGYFKQIQIPLFKKILKIANRIFPVETPHISSIGTSIVSPFLAYQKGVFFSTPTSGTKTWRKLLDFT